MQDKPISFIIKKAALLGPLVFNVPPIRLVSTICQ